MCHIYTVIMKRNKKRLASTSYKRLTRMLIYLLPYALASETSTGMWVEDEWIPVPFKSTVFWDVTPCSLTQIYRFGDACCLPLHGISFQFLRSVGKFLPDYTFKKKAFFNVTTLRDLTSHKQFWYKINIVKDEKGDLVRDCNSISVRWRHHSSQLLKVHGVMILRRQNYIQQNHFCVTRLLLRFRLPLKS